MARAGARLLLVLLIVSHALWEGDCPNYQRGHWDGEWLRPAALTAACEQAAGGRDPQLPIPAPHLSLGLATRGQGGQFLHYERFDSLAGPQGLGLEEFDPQPTRGCFMGAPRRTIGTPLDPERARHWVMRGICKTWRAILPQAAPARWLCLRSPVQGPGNATDALAYQQGMHCIWYLCRESSLGSTLEERLEPAMWPHVVCWWHWQTARQHCMTRGHPPTPHITRFHHESEWQTLYNVGEARLQLGLQLPPSIKPREHAPSKRLHNNTNSLFPRLDQQRGATCRREKQETQSAPRAPQWRTSVLGTTQIQHGRSAGPSHSCTSPSVRALEHMACTAAGPSVLKGERRALGNRTNAFRSAACIRGAASRGQGAPAGKLGRHRAIHLLDTVSACPPLVPPAGSIAAYVTTADGRRLGTGAQPDPPPPQLQFDAQQFQSNRASIRDHRVTLAGVLPSVEELGRIPGAYDGVYPRALSSRAFTGEPSNDGGLTVRLHGLVTGIVKPAQWKAGEKRDGLTWPQRQLRGACLFLSNAPASTIAEEAAFCTDMEDIKSEVQECLERAGMVAELEWDPARPQLWSARSGADVVMAQVRTLIARISRLEDPADSASATLVPGIGEVLGALSNARVAAIPPKLPNPNSAVPQQQAGAEAALNTPPHLRVGFLEASRVGSRTPLTRCEAHWQPWHCYGCAALHTQPVKGQDNAYQRNHYGARRGVGRGPRKPRNVTSPLTNALTGLSYAHSLLVAYGTKPLPQPTLAGNERALVRAMEPGAVKQHAAVSLSNIFTIASLTMARTRGVVPPGPIPGGSSVAGSAAGSVAGGDAEARTEQHLREVAAVCAMTDFRALEMTATAAGDQARHMMLHALTSSARALISSPGAFPLTLAVRAGPAACISLQLHPVHTPVGGHRYSLAITDGPSLLVGTGPEVQSRLVQLFTQLAAAPGPDSHPRLPLAFVTHDGAVLRLHLQEGTEGGVR